MKLPNFVNPSADCSSKIGHDFSNDVVQKMKLSELKSLSEKFSTGFNSFKSNHFSVILDFMRKK